MSSMTSNVLPHQIGVSDIANPELKKVAMLFMENFKSIARQMTEVLSVSAMMKRALAANAIEIDAVDRDARRRLAEKADLDDSGKVPASQLPSYVDDVLEFASLADFPAEGEGGKIYVAIDTDKVYRWSGTQYVEVAPAPALARVAETGDYNDLENKPNLATVATSGSYNDLSDKPTIPDMPDMSNYLTREMLEDPSPLPLVEFPAWTKPNTYNIGDGVTYNGAKYVCKQSHSTTTQSTFNTSQWKAVDTITYATHFAGEIGIYNNTSYRCNTGYTGSWNAAYWEQVRIEEDDRGLVISRVLAKLKVVNSVAVCLPAALPENFSNLRFPMSGLVPDDTKTYYVTATFCNASVYTVTARLKSDSNTVSGSVAANGGTATLGPLEVSGSGWVAIAQGNVGNTAIIKVYSADS